MKLTAQMQSALARREVRRSARAFTILEVMIAAMVLVLTITSSLQVLGYGLKAIDSARYTTLAGQVLQSQMEKLRLLTWSQLTDPNTGAVQYPTFIPDPGLVPMNQLNNFSPPQGSCTQNFNLSTPSLVGITLTATWTGSDGIKRSRTYYTIYAKQGVSDRYYTANNSQ